MQLVKAFHGAKAAVFIGDDLLIYQRDEDVEWGGFRDFPGGGREGDETPRACLAREICEEFGLNLDQGVIVWSKAVPAMRDARQIAWFFVVTFPLDSKDRITFGNEGQCWQVQPLEHVMNLPNLVPALQTRLSLWLQDAGRDPT